MVAGSKSVMDSTTRRCGGWYLFWRGCSVFGLGAATRVYLAPGVTDMRKGFDGLYGLVRDQLMCDPRSGHVFLFSNSRRNRLKLMFWDGTGLWVCSKRISKGSIGWPQAVGAENKIVLSHEELALLLGGIDLTQTRLRKWYRRPVAEEPHKSQMTA
jgi:transposase